MKYFYSAIYHMVSRISGDDFNSEIKASMFLSVIISNLIQGILCFPGIGEMDLVSELGSPEAYGYA